MTFPNRKKPLVPEPVSMQGSLCRSYRRKSARRDKTSSQAVAVSILKAKTEQIPCRPSQRQSAFMVNDQPSGQNPGRELFLQAIVEACASNVAVLDESGKILYVSKPWRLATQTYGPDGARHPLSLKYVERRNGPNYFGSNHSSAIAEDIQAILDGKVREFQNEYFCPSLSGPASWFVVHAARLDLPDRPGAFRVLVNSSDITHGRQTELALRDLGGRLITAQEEERSRVARELHDDLNQRMALLSVELEQLSARMPARQSNLRLSINSVCERAQEISAEIHRVAYQLHPSKLDHLGLVAALKSHCLELAAHHEIKISFEEKGCSGLLPKAVTLCLFRIVQEAFRNVIKHSGAREASVELVGTPEGIHLSLSDTGIGFDVDSLESKGGLGLISMRERLRLVGGVISIQSTAKGTKIEVWAPLTFSDTRSEELPVRELGKVSYLAPVNV